MNVLRELLSKTASVFVNYFAIFERVDYVTKQKNFYKSITFSKSRDVN